jgi:hypothetical protein
MARAIEDCDALCGLAEVLAAARRTDKAAAALEQALECYEGTRNLAMAAQVHQRLARTRERGREKDESPVLGRAVQTDPPRPFVVPVPSSTDVFELAASRTARMSSIRLSSVPRSRGRSDRPVPRLSRRRSRANAPSRS